MVFGLRAYSRPCAGQGNWLWSGWMVKQVSSVTWTVDVGVLIASGNGEEGDGGREVEWAGQETSTSPLCVPLITM